jgi:hypothetical protein
VNRKAYDTLRSISDDEWRLLIKALGRYALSVSRRLRWRTRNAEELPGGETLESIVSKAIQNVFVGAMEHADDDSRPKAGVRRWNPEKDPDLKAYLMDVVKSTLSHLATGTDNTLFRVIPEVGTEDEADWESGSSTQRTADTEWLARPARTPEEMLIEDEDAEIADRALQMLVEAASDDPVVLKVIEAMRAGNGKPAEIARATGIDVRDVYTAMKRLDRKAEFISKKIKTVTTTIWRSFD